MTNEKVCQVCQLYVDKLRERFSQEASPDPELVHVVEMCQKIPGFLAENRIQKAHRWLGFVQGVLATKGIYTIEHMKDHNREDA